MRLAVRAETQLDSVGEQLREAQARGQAAAEQAAQVDASLQQRTQELQQARAGLRSLESKHEGLQVGERVACKQLRVLSVRAAPARAHKLRCQPASATHPPDADAGRQQAEMGRTSACCCCAQSSWLRELQPWTGPQLPGLLQRELQAAGSRLRSQEQELQDTRQRLQTLTTELQQVSRPCWRPATVPSAGCVTGSVPCLTGASAQQPVVHGTLAAVWCCCALIAWQFQCLSSDVGLHCGAGPEAAAAVPPRKLQCSRCRLRVAD